jgi:hypothetical protein
MLRAGLTRKMGYLRATAAAARVARWSTLAMAVYAFYIGSFTLLLIAGMIFMLSWVEVAQAHMGEAYRSAAAGQPFPGFRPASSATVVDQYGNPVDGWSSAQGGGPQGSSWTVRTVRWLK